MRIWAFPIAWTPSWTELNWASPSRHRPRLALWYEQKTVLCCPLMLQSFPMFSFTSVSADVLQVSLAHPTKTAVRFPPQTALRYQKWRPLRRERFSIKASGTDAFDLRIMWNWKWAQSQTTAVSSDDYLPWATLLRLEIQRVYVHVVSSGYL